MLLGSNGLHCCCRSLFRATINCKLPLSASLVKSSSQSAASLVLGTSRTIFTITRGSSTPGYMSHYSRTAILRSSRCIPSTPLDWSLSKMRSHSDPAASPTLNLDVLKVQKFGQDILLYSHNNRNECVVYNVITAIIFGVMSYAAYKIYTEAQLARTEDVWEERNDLLKSKTVVPLYRYYDLNPYREVLSASCFVIGGLLCAAVLRYTLRCVHHLTLLKDAKTIVFTTSNVWGRPITRRVPINQAYTDGLNDLVRDHNACLLHVQGTLVPYALDKRGTLHEPYLVRQFLGTAKENKRKDDPIDN